MGLLNCYITREEYLAWQTTQTPSTNTLDDAVIDSIIESVSRFIDDHTGRLFYPSMGSKVYDTPIGCYDLSLYDDLLELTTLTNGDLSVIGSSDYYLYPSNMTPYHTITLKKSSSIIWEYDDDGNDEQAITINGVWGYHDRYSKAWKAVGVLDTAMADTTSLTVSTSDVTPYGVGSIIKVGSEIMNVATVNASSLTVDTRGDNGSTAATHLIAAPIYIWQVVQPVKQATYIITHSFYRKRFGENVTSNAVIAGGGVIISPQDIPFAAMTLLQRYLRIA